MHRLRRSKLFAPGNRPDLMSRAAETAADALSLDLEDAVPPAEKASAREHVAAFLDALGKNTTGAHNKEIIVRVNSLDSGEMLEDLFAVVGPHLDMVNLPKVESPRDVHVAEAVLDHLEARRNIGRPIGIMTTLETPAGIRRATEIAASSPRMVALQFGVGDFTAAAGIKPAPHRLAMPRTALVFAAVEAGIDALDSAWPDIADTEGFEADTQEARDSGFHGKSCIHPSQIEAVNRIFAFSPEEVARAQEIVSAYEAAAAEGRGAIKLKGRLIDTAHVKQARRVLDSAHAAAQILRSDQ